jgi:Family of unknown function (DUF5678)
MSLDGTKWEAIPSHERERYGDAAWALHNAEVQRRYNGQWVLAFNRAIIASGKDACTALEAAQHQVKGQTHYAVFCVPDDRSSWLGESADASPDFGGA